MKGGKKAAEGVILGNQIDPSNCGNILPKRASHLNISPSISGKQSTFHLEAKRKGGPVEKIYEKSRS